MRKILITMAIILTTATLTACDTVETPPQNTPSANTSVDTGIGSQDATADVKIDNELKTDTFSPYVNVTVTNNSEKTSDYYITVTLNSADGSEQLDNSVVFVDALKPGQVKKDKLVFISLDNDDLPKNVVITLETVQRTATR